MIMTIVEKNIGYIPTPNTMEFHFTEETPTIDLTPTAFLFPITNEGHIVLARHVGEEAHRGISIPGGHVDPGETLMEAAVREAIEETGSVIVNDTAMPIGYQKTISYADKPDGYKYPFPISHQQFYVGRAEKLIPVSAEECGDPIILDPLQALLSLPRRRDRIVCYAAIMMAEKMQWLICSKNDLEHILSIHALEDAEINQIRVLRSLTNIDPKELEFNAV